MHPGIVKTSLYFENYTYSSSRYVFNPKGFIHHINVTLHSTIWANLIKLSRHKIHLLSFYDKRLHIKTVISCWVNGHLCKPTYIELKHQYISPYDIIDDHSLTTLKSKIHIAYEYYPMCIIHILITAWKICI